PHLPIRVGMRPPHEPVTDHADAKVFHSLKDTVKRRPALLADELAADHNADMRLYFRILVAIAGATLIAFTPPIRAAEEPPATQPIRVVDGIVMPRQPVPAAIEQAMAFLRKGDGAYVPGRIDGELAGYFLSAHVNDDGSRSDRQQCFPARQHAYFIFTFL